MLQWVVFYYQGKELMRYSIKGTFFGEYIETRKLLAYENGIKEEDILIKLI